MRSAFDSCKYSSKRIQRLANIISRSTTFLTRHRMLVTSWAKLEFEQKSAFTLIPMPSAKSSPVSDVCASINEPDTFAASTSIVRGHRIMAFNLGSTFSIAAAVAKGAAKFLVLVLLLLFLLLLFFKWKIYHKKRIEKFFKHVWNSLASIVTASAGADLPFGRPQIWR